MAIIQELVPFFEVDAFVEGLQKAARGVLLVATPGPSVGLGTGWMITDSLVVIPDFMAHQYRGDPAERIFYCHFLY